jgi:uncharacterized Zn finger protein (UPF0148 family)
MGVLEDVPCIPDSRSDRVICVICSSRSKREDRDDEGEVRVRTHWKLTSSAREKDLAKAKRASTEVDAEDGIRRVREWPRMNHSTERKKEWNRGGQKRGRSRAG